MVFGHPVSVASSLNLCRLFCLNWERGQGLKQIRVLCVDFGSSQRKNLQNDVTRGTKNKTKKEKVDDNNIQHNH